RSRSGRSPPALDRPRNVGEQRFVVERLVQDGDRASSEGALPGLLVGVPRDHDHRQPRVSAPPPPPGVPAPGSRPSGGPTRPAPPSRFPASASAALAKTSTSYSAERRRRCNALRTEASSSTTTTSALAAVLSVPRATVCARLRLTIPPGNTRRGCAGRKLDDG